MFKPISARLCIVTIFAGCALSAMAGNPADIISGPKAGEMDEFLSRLERFGFNGSALVAQKGGIIFARGYGIAQPSTGKRWTPETAASIGSVVKQFTATAILKLEMEGKLSVSDKLADHFRDVPKDKAGITLHQLLTHSSGFPPAIGDDFDEITRDEYLREALDTPLDFSPGEEYQYSNVAYSILAMIVEDKNGLQYEEYLRKKIFDPLNMKNTGWRLPNWSDVTVSESFDHEPPNNTILRLPEDRWHIEGNGGLLSTSLDMYRWYQALHTNRILSKSAREKMFTRHMREGPGANSFYGYGWVVMNTRRGGDVIWHNGGGAGGYFAMYQYVNDSTVFIVFSNKKIDGEIPVDNIAVILSNLLFGDPVPMPPAVMEVGIDKLKEYAGTYRTETVRFKVSANKASGALDLTPEGQLAMDALFPSEMAGHLPKYNALSQEFVTHLSRGEYQSAAQMFERFAPLDELAEMLQNTWSELSANGELKSVTVHGTRLSEDAESYLTLNFANRSETLKLAWMMGKCVGLRAKVTLPRKELRPIDSELDSGLDSGRFASYSLSTGQTDVSFTPDGVMVIHGPDGDIRAARAN